MNITEELIEKYTSQLTDKDFKRFREIVSLAGLKTCSKNEIVTSYLEQQYTGVNWEKVLTNVDSEFRDCSYLELIEKLTKVDKGSWSILGRQSRAMVDSAVKEIDVILPSSLKRYLYEVGGMNLGDSFLPSIGKKNHATNLMRDTKHHIKVDGLPEGFFVIISDYDDPHLSCLDLRLMEESDCPVVLYNKYKGSFDGIISVNFDIWFRNKIKMSIDAAKRCDF